MWLLQVQTTLFRYLISGRGMYPLPEKYQGIKNLPVPKEPLRKLGRC